MGYSPQEYRAFLIISLFFKGTMMSQRSGIYFRLLRCFFLKLSASHTWAFSSQCGLRFWVIPSEKLDSCLN